MSKDFEDTDSDGTTMDSRKPLTAGVEELIERIETALALHNEGGPLASTPMKIPAGAYRALVDAKRLLSLLTPPTDAAVREAVEWIEKQLNNGWWEKLAAAKARILLSYVRAVQAPRLSSEQHRVVRIAVINADLRGDTEESEALRAAFPEAFAGEVGRG